MEPKLDRSVPKDQIAALLCSMLIGIAAGLAATYFAIGSKGITLMAIAYAIFGAFGGAMDLTYYRGYKHRRAFWMIMIGLAILVPFGFNDLLVCRETFGGIVAWIVAGGLISTYHFAKAAQDA